MLNLLFHQRFLLLEFRYRLLLTSGDFLRLLLVLVFLLLEIVLEFLHLLFKPTLDFVVLSFVFLLELLERLQLVGHDLMAGFELGLLLECQFPLLLQSDLLRARFFFAYSQLLAVPLTSFHLHFLLQTVLIDCMVALDGDNFEGEGELRFSKVQMLLGEVTTVCVVVVRYLTKGILNLLE